MVGWTRWILVAAILVIVAVVPFVNYRYVYTHSKRLREVAPGKVYRSGQMTAPGFAKAVAELNIRTVVNLQDDFPDPDIRQGYFTAQTIKESALCEQLGVRYVALSPDLVGRNRSNEKRPRAIGAFLDLMDDPDTYPVLLHCKAGLHRTGVMVAIYRMEYEGWSKSEAIRELKRNGFGESVCIPGNEYITQYVLQYQPGLRRATEADEDVLVPRKMALQDLREPRDSRRP
jgi:protein tyrosine/serine phosphatase